MTNPVILAIDDDGAVLNAVERDLRSKFGRDYRVVKANSGAAALDFIKQLQARNEAVALFLADQRMPQMTGIQFLEKAREIYPEAKRVLLTAYADTEVAIASINKLQLDYYLMKLWDPPEDNLYPVLVDLLEDWRGSVKHCHLKVFVLREHCGRRKSHEVKDFFARHQIAYQWLNIEDDPKARAMAEEHSGGTLKLPVVFFPDGKVLVEPEIQELAQKTGVQTKSIASLV